MAAVCISWTFRMRRVILHLYDNIQAIIKAMDERQLERGLLGWIQVVGWDLLHKALKHKSWHNIEVNL